MSTAALNTRPARPLPAELRPYRACDLCRFGIDIGGIRHCVCADVVLPVRPQPVHVVRAPTGPCGSEARHLDFPGLRG